MEAKRAICVVLFRSAELYLRGKTVTYTVQNFTVEFYFRGEMGT